jgi:signal peptidase I
VTLPDASPEPTPADAPLEGEPEAERNERDETAAVDRKARRRRSARRNTIEWIVVIAGALLVAFVIKTFFVQAFYIPSRSMEPTLQVRDRVLVNKLVDDADDLHRGDIIVFERPDEAGPGDVRDLIKRVVGLPGDEIEAHDGHVYIDGEELAESYLPDDTLTPDFRRQSVPRDHIFVLGDNRDDSAASNVFGPVSEDLIVGRAFIRVWPLDDIGGV